MKAFLLKHGPKALHRLRQPRVGLDNGDTRARWVENVLRTLPAGLRLLDAGAGEQPYRACCAHLKYIAQDFAQYDGKGDGTGLQRGKWDQSNLDLVCDILNIPEADASFDVILCTEVLEHVTDPVPVIREFARLLKPGGIAIITAPFVSFTHFAPHHYHTGFSRYFYLHHLARAGFDVREISPNGNFFEFVAQEIRRIPWAAERYSGRITKLDGLLIKLLLRTLSRLSSADRGSSEFATFGLHVIATRHGSADHV
jgi:SAM-dependent methyltransferase